MITTEELEFRGIEKAKDGTYRAIYCSKKGARILVSEQELRSPHFLRDPYSGPTLGTRKGAIHALTQTKNVKKSKKA